jgi:tetrapyrrole methylase family protein/MazG family protein
VLSVSADPNKVLPDAGAQLHRLLEIVSRLRGENGCPWDREQTLESLKPYLIEEAYEVIDAIEHGNAKSHAEELGDVLLQIALHAQIGSEQGQFTFADIIRGLSEKLVRRHPHVFGDVQAADTSAVLRNWEKIKSSEKSGERRSVLEGVPRHLPALQKAQRIQSRAARVGFDWSKADDVIAKVEEELREIRDAIRAGDAAAIREEIGDLLFAVVNLGRFHQVDSEDALRGTIRKFQDRFQEIERRVHAQGRTLPDCSLEEMDAIWEDVKAGERKAELERAARA